LVEDWTHLQLLTNRHKHGCGFFPLLASMFGGRSERQLDDLLAPGSIMVETQVNKVE
jgi:hypothetical protein